MKIIASQVFCGAQAQVFGASSAFAEFREMLVGGESKFNLYDAMSSWDGFQWAVASEAMEIRRVGVHE